MHLGHGLSGSPLACFFILGLVLRYLLCFPGGESLSSLSPPPGVTGQMQHLFLTFLSTAQMEEREGRGRGPLGHSGRGPGVV